MDYYLIIEIIAIIGLILGLYLIYLSYSIFSENKLSMGWLAMTLAFGCVFLRRVTSFLNDFFIFEKIDQFLLPLEEVLLIFISILFIVALVTLKNDLENQGILDRNHKIHKKK